jgi:hypothetical protein
MMRNADDELEGAAGRSPKGAALAKRARAAEPRLD